MTNLVKRPYTAPQDTLGVPLVVHAVGCIMSPEVVAYFVADQIRWVQCSRKRIITTPQLLRALRRRLPEGDSAWVTFGDILVVFEKYRDTTALYCKGHPRFFRVPVHSDGLCEPNTVWVVDVGYHFAWGDGVMWHVEAREGTA